MNNIGNLGASQAAPAAQGLAGKTATQGDNNSFFSALLTQQMGGADLSNVSDDGASPDLAQGLPGGAGSAEVPHSFSRAIEGCKIFDAAESPDG